ncbi:P-loop containing nucleoside triphosphate hydrolase protein [Macroventuria anomochaeta]|uniref:P-loop containing nucleoside triphosphate hydrolase protein n=1 Tax=Macroventuria anomochaeta TaxID=301207 RepID=A0ACB6RWY6_9PLEO|nr:P-loop containing nucleoside triphosphate hydrolase protein [Macroventuria anomochaeta]KAF2626490.1 P-loop containing nucleoside triphosphate hydrolase protein [Macroventuria anomochaeta]
MADKDAPARPQSSHRLPTVSASQALQSLNARGARAVPTGLTQLDKLLSPPSLPGHDVAGGYARGKVTEVHGPSGVGKTSLLLQAAANALREGQHVYWIDGACAPLIPQRLHDMLAAPSGTPSEFSPDELHNCFHHLAAPTLAHILALFMHPPASFPQSNASLVVVDSLSTLIDNAYPRNTDDRVKNKTDQSKWAAGRRYAVINDLIATFTKFAALHDVALVITCQTITRIRGASRALLVSAITGIEWENGISARLLLFRDWVPQQGKVQDKVGAERLQKVRFAGLVKVNGVALADEGGVGNVVPFAIESHGFCDIDITADDTATTMVLPIQARPPKRTFDEVDENVAEEPNSDEVYGWIEDDGVATEGLLIDDAPITSGMDARQDSAAKGRSTKVMRTSTV